MSLVYELISEAFVSLLIEAGRRSVHVCIRERISYLPLPDSFWKHESRPDSHIIKLLFQGIQFKLGFGFALVGKLKLLCLGILFDSKDSRIPDLMAMKGSEMMICLWFGQGNLLSSYKRVPHMCKAAKLLRLCTKFVRLVYCWTMGKRQKIHLLKKKKI